MNSSLPLPFPPLRSLASPERATFFQRFFKTGPGEYAEGDRFLGIPVPLLRRVAREHRTLSRKQVLGLLRSPWHEERLLALFLMVHAYSRSTDLVREEIVASYLAHTRYINNWDLVDSSAPYVLGPHVHDAPPSQRRRREKIVKDLARSSDLWERRIAMLATFHGIRADDYRLALDISTMLVDDHHDLIHKAVGWMLREIGNRDREAEETFLREHCRTMPRTMLRYAIEKFPETLRQRYLAGTMEA